MSELARGTRLLWLFTSFPLLFMIAFFTAGYVPAKWRNLYILATCGGVLTAIITIPVREQLRQERKHGLTPKQRGFSRKLDALAEKLRAHAAEAEVEEDWQLSRTTQSVIKELKRLALKQDQREILQDFDLDTADPRRLRDAAGELELYAQNVRGRGGIFKLDTMQIVMGAIAFLGAFVWGCALIREWWDTPSWSFFGGVFLIVASSGLSYALVKSQREGA